MSALSVRTLLDVTDEVLLTEQSVPRWVAAAWSDAFAAAGPPIPAGELPEEPESSP